MATPIDDDTLQRFYDGDLSPVEARSVQARLAEDASARRRLAELGRLSTLIRDAAGELGSRVDSASLFTSIEARIAKEPAPGIGARLRVVASEWMTHRRATVVPALAATAVAAATLLTVLRPGTPTGLESETPHARLPSEAEAEVVLVQGSHVEEVDFGASTGTVFEIDNQGVGVAVVWISDEEGL